MKTLLFLSLANILSPSSFGNIYYQDGYGPLPLKKYEGDYANFEPGSEYTIRALLVRLNQPVEVKDKLTNKTSYLFFGLQIDLRFHPEFGHADIKFLNQSPIYPIDLLDPSAFSLYLYVDANIIALDQPFPCSEIWCGEEERYILRGSFTAVPETTKP